MLPIYQVDAFSNQLFGGNPAAVVPLSKWLPDTVMLAIAAENNLAETAFFVQNPDGTYHLRWFTPELEVPLCGHATLATAHVLFDHLGITNQELVFHSASGPLTVTQKEGRIELNLPAEALSKIRPTQALIDGLGIQPIFTGMAKHYLLAEAPDEACIRALSPDFTALASVEALGIIVTAPGNDVDFVSRFFAPKAGINEDPVTGSAHCVLVPFWANKLGKTNFMAQQLSKRSGTLWCTLEGDRVRMSGYAKTYLTGTFVYE
ncbi:MAG: PhzF family phenazine biosynthesis protein [Bacteroidetes Order II. Incertae sedis bacterium]|nr:PhzF family phenazine biosynthesis protein [Bacteroidetes Order II. bacterium]